MSLFEDTKAPRARWTGTRLPAVYTGPRACTHCGTVGVLPLPPVTYEPLLRHAGYGEAVRVSAVWCPACNRTSEVQRESIRPLRVKT